MANHTKSIKEKWNRWIYKEDGAVAVLVAVAMIGLIGASSLVVDLGVSYNEASKLQNALDSAALAAVLELPATGTATSQWNNALAAATQYASLNGYEGITVTPVYANGLIVGAKTDGKHEVIYQLAPIIGIESGELDRTATAKLKTATGLSNLIPVAIPDPIVEAILDDGQLYLKGGPQDKEYFKSFGGWRGMWYPDDESWNQDQFLEYYKNGYPNIINIGDTLEEKDGTVTSASDEAYHSRMDGHESCTVDHCVLGMNPCPRVVTAPIVEVKSKNLEVVSFASFFLEPALMDGKKIKEIKATYIETIVLSGEARGDVTDSYGIYVPKLVD